MTELLGWLVLIAAAAYVGWRRILVYLRYFQQEGYENPRFLRWAGFRSLTDPALWLSAAGAVVVAAAPAATSAVALVLLVLAAAQPDPRSSGKITLRLTDRARRILTGGAALAAVLWILIAAGLSDLGGAGACLATAVVLAILPLALVLSNAVLSPYEKQIQAGFEEDARRRVADIQPFIVGITGSYGKSSSKAMLAHVLQFHGPTLSASGSVNTLMGVTRHVRDELVRGHEFMVVEMGAFRVGSIARLCQLTPPSAGLITAVGDMHLERFGSLDEIVRAKGELARALPPLGRLVVNADSPGALRIAKASTQCTVLLYGEMSTEDLDTRVEGITFSREGTTFTLRTRTARHACFTPLLGRPIIMNLTGVFTLATSVGVPAEVVVASMRTLRPVSNRLEVVEEGGITWVRDAYNSNQFGFRAALEVASALPAGRRFLVTPGVVELGSEQFAVNKALSREAAAVCDRTVVVSQTNRDAFVEGHREAGRADRLIAVAGRADAFARIRELASSGDLVILENDLPDLYEGDDRLFWPARKRREEAPAS